MFLFPLRAFLKLTFVDLPLYLNLFLIINLANLRNSQDQSMRTLAEKIYNDTFDANMMLSQHHKLEKSTTTFRMKVENEAVEKKTPNISISVPTKPIDLDKITNRIKEITSVEHRPCAYEDNYE